MESERPEQAVEDAANDVIEEYYRSINLYGVFHSPHEGYAILLEEVNELWDEIKKDLTLQTTWLYIGKPSTLLQWH